MTSGSPRPRSFRVLSVGIVGIVVASLVVGACSSKDPATAAPGGAEFARVQAGLNKRVALVHDYRLEGTAKDLATGVTKKLTLAFSQPQYLRATIGEAQANDPQTTDLQTMVFDGEALVLLDHASRQAARLERSAGEENLLLTMYQAFSDVTCEGWRPPLLRPKVTTAATAAGPDGDRWTLTTPIDDPSLKEERVVLRTADASFVEKQTFDRAGNVVAFTRVLEDLTDPATGMKFPRRWEKQGATGHYEISITQAVVNGGVAADSFKTALPDGFQLAVPADSAKATP